jgi:hypothetical protein|tara:strand:- start:2902 stop:3420 length:519 start_codon:yes stop_codon:yes gene_type:complete
MMYIMIYDKLAKGDDGLYHVRVFTDDRKKHFVQLNDVTITDITGDISFDISTPEKVDAIHEVNIQNAIDNSQEWFGKKLAEKTLRSAYTREDTLTAERLVGTKVFNSEKALVDLDIIKPGDVCSVIVEFSGLWFAKKAFGPSWNIVQVKVHPAPEEKFDETYPDEYMFEDDE